MFNAPLPSHKNPFLPHFVMQCTIERIISLGVYCNGHPRINIKVECVHMKKGVTMYKPSRLLASFYIAGFQYHDGACVLDNLKVGKKLKLVPEFDNPHDSEAVAIYWKKAHLGYVPQEASGWLPAMLYFGHSDAFECRVMQVNAQADPWKQVRVGIYVVDSAAYD